MTMQVRGSKLAARLTASMAALALLGTGAVALAQNWSTTVVASDNGHKVGNPKAKTKLVEFMSYTCSHCADFAREGDAAIKLAYLPKGDVSYEIRHLLRDPFDLTAALLTQCFSPREGAAHLAGDVTRGKGQAFTARLDAEVELLFARGEAVIDILDARKLGQTLRKGDAGLVEDIGIPM